MSISGVSTGITGILLAVGLQANREGQWKPPNRPRGRPLPSQAGGKGVGLVERPPRLVAACSITRSGSCKQALVKPGETTPARTQALELGLSGSEQVHASASCNAAG